MTTQYVNDVAGSSDPLRTNPSSRRGTYAWAIAWLGALLVLLPALSLWWSHRDNVVHLPDAERRALYDRTIDTLASFCDPQHALPGIEDYCRRQAAFAVQFPECDATCVKLAEPHRPHPAR